MQVSKKCITKVAKRRRFFLQSSVKYSENMTGQHSILDLVIETTIKEELLNCI